MEKTFLYTDTNIDKKMEKELKNFFSKEEIQKLEKFLDIFINKLPEQDKLYYCSAYAQKYKLFITVQKNI